MVPPAFGSCCSEGSGEGFVSSGSEELLFGKTAIREGLRFPALAKRRSLPPGGLPGQTPTGVALRGFVPESAACSSPAWIFPPPRNPRRSGCRGRPGDRAGG